MKDGLLILNLHPDLEVTIHAIRIRFGQEECFDPRPAEAPNSVPSYTRYRLKEARLAFGFLWSTLDMSGTWPRARRASSPQGSAFCLACVTLPSAVG